MATEDDTVRAAGRLALYRTGIWVKFTPDAFGEPLSRTLRQAADAEKGTSERLDRLKAAVALLRDEDDPMRAWLLSEMANLAVHLGNSDASQPWHRWAVSFAEGAIEALSNAAAMPYDGSVPWILTTASDVIRSRTDGDVATHKE